MQLSKRSSKNKTKEKGQFRNGRRMVGNIGGQASLAAPCVPRLGEGTEALHRQDS